MKVLCTSLVSVLVFFMGWQFYLVGLVVGTWRHRSFRRSFSVIFIGFLRKLRVLGVSGWLRSVGCEAVWK